MRRQTADGVTNPRIPKNAVHRVTLTMRSGVITFHDRQRQRLANLAREVTMHARDGDEIVKIERVVEAAHAGVLAIEEARQALAGLRAEQQRRSIQARQAA